MGNIEALRRLAGGPKLEAAKAVAGFLHWAANYVPPSRFSWLEIDGMSSSAFAAPEQHSAPDGYYAKCRRCACKADKSGLCFHCVFDEPCPKVPSEESSEPSRFSFLEVDNVDHDVVADGVVMAFFALLSSSNHERDIGATYRLP